MPDPILVMILLSLVPVLMHTGFSVTENLFVPLSIHPKFWFCLQEPLACLLFFVGVCRCASKNTESMSAFVKKIILPGLIILFSVFFLGGTSLSRTSISLLGIKIILVYGLVVWIKASLIPLRPDQWIKMGWKTLIPLASANILVTALRLAF